jgi:P4 family phage/plasmid primase-like protien
MGAVAERLLGQPNRKEGDHKQIWRYGRKSGSLVVDVEKGVWDEKDPSATGITKGGVLDLIVFKKGLSNGEAVNWLRAEGLVETPADSFDPLTFWRDGKPIRNTLAARYLSDDRKIDPKTVTPDIARFHPAHRANGKPETKAFPAIIFPAYDAAGTLKAIQAVRLTSQAKKLSAAAKISGGRIKGAALRAPGDRSRGIVLVEGPEDMLATWQSSGRECWATTSVSLLGDAPLPSGCDVTIPVDRGSEESTRLQAEKLARRGHTVRLATPPEGCKDANEALKKHGAAAVVAMLDSAKVLEPPAEADADGRKVYHDLAAIGTNEDAIALVFAERHADTLRYCHDWGMWLRWDGIRWIRERRRLAFHFAREIAREANWEGKATPAKASTAGGVERFAQADPRLATVSDEWDTDQWLLNTPGGTVDLRTGELRPHRREDHITKQTAVTPAPVLHDDHPLWTEFLSKATKGDAKLQRFLQQMVGYCLTGDVREECLFFVYGVGGNGKGVFLKTIGNILGDYATSAAMDTFTASHSDKHPTDLAKLKSARMVTASETEEGRAWAESRIKELTGNERPISARFMRQDFFEYWPTFKLVFVGNHKPVLRNVDEAAKRRFNIIPFTHKPEAPDTELKDKLRTEYPAILRWMIDGCLDWQKNGLVRPPVVIEATAEYFSEQDSVRQWIEECCDTGGTRLSDTTENLYTSWTAWITASGEKPGTKKSFSQSLLQQGFELVAETPGHRKKRGFLRISVKAKETSNQWQNRAEADDADPF